MTAVVNILNSLLAVLKLALDSEYYKQSLNCGIDQKLRGLISKIVALEQADLDSILEKVSGDNARVLGLFAERMASLAVRLNSVEHVKDGLAALLVYSRSEDPRDVLLVLSLLHDASIKTFGNAKDVFSEVSASVGGVDLLDGFLRRSDEDKSIEAMGYEESKNEEGFLYVRTW